MSSEIIESLLGKRSERRIMPRNAEEDTQQLNVAIPRDLKTALKIAALRREVSLAQLIIECLSAEVKDELDRLREEGS